MEKRVFLSASATFIRTDTTTHGNWSAAYGDDGYDIFGASASLPSYAQVSTNAPTYVWSTTTNSINALQNAPWATGPSGGGRTGSST